MDRADNLVAGDPQLMHEALHHIARAAAASRTQTRRLRFIEQRAQWAMQGKPYERSAFDPPHMGPGPTEKLRDAIAALRALLDVARKLDSGESLRTDEYEQAIKRAEEIVR